MIKPEPHIINTERLNKAIYQQIVELSYKALASSVYVTFVIAIAMVAVLKHEVDHTILGNWFAFIILVNIFRYVIYILYFRSETRYDNITLWDRLFYLLLLLNSLSLCAVSIFMMPESSSVYHYFPVMILIGMSAGAVPALAFSLRNIITYILLLLVPVFINEIIIATYMSYSVAALTIALIIFSIVNSIRFKNMTIDNIRLHFLSDEHKNELIESKNLAIEASTTKTMFISTISHELRTPLNAIMGFGQLLKMSDVVKPDSEEYDNANGVIESGKHLLSLIEELLDLSKLESGKLVINIKEISLLAAISESIGILNPIADKYKIKIINNASDDYLVYADIIRLRQVIINLISNAIKYNLRNGSVIIDVSKTTGNRVRVTVTDTGTGLSAEQQATLFQTFQRFDTTREGIGLGLYITKKIINLMHGDIGVESKINKGSTFWFELPLVV